jgi:hypothetical protein
MADPIMNVTIQLAPNAPVPDPEVQRECTVIANAALPVLHKYVTAAVEKHLLTLNLGPLHDPAIDAINKEMPSVAGPLSYTVLMALKAYLKAGGKTLS